MKHEKDYIKVYEKDILVRRNSAGKAICVSKVNYVADEKVCMNNLIKVNRTATCDVATSSHQKEGDGGILLKSVREGDPLQGSYYYTYEHASAQVKAAVRVSLQENMRRFSYEIS